MRTNSFKARAVEFIENNPNLKRKDYIAAFVEMGMMPETASLYHYAFVTKVRKAAVKIVVKAGPVRDPKTGRFMKRAA